MTKHRLILDEREMKTEGQMLGIVSSTSHLEFVHSLNKAAHFNFERTEDIEWEGPEGKEFFLCFLYEDKQTEDLYRLVRNKGSRSTISRELKGMDYLLTILSENEKIFGITRDLLSKQKFIQAVTLIPTHTLSDRSRKIIPL